MLFWTCLPLYYIVNKLNHYSLTLSHHQHPLAKVIDLFILSIGLLSSAFFATFLQCACNGFLKCLNSLLSVSTPWNIQQLDFQKWKQRFQSTTCWNLIVQAIFFFYSFFNHYFSPLHLYLMEWYLTQSISLISKTCCLYHVHLWTQVLLGSDSRSSRQLLPW